MDRNREKIIVTTDCHNDRKSIDKAAKYLDFSSELEYPVANAEAVGRGGSYE